MAAFVNNMICISDEDAAQRAVIVNNNAGYLRTSPMQYVTKDLLAGTTFTPNFDKNIIENISWSRDNFHTHHAVATSLKNKNPYTITILIELLKFEYRNRKEYVKKSKIPIGNKYKELLYDYFFEEFGQEKGNTMFGLWLDKYRPIHEKERKYEFADEYIVKHEFEPKYRAVILKRFKNHEKLFKERIKIYRERYYNLPEPFTHVDWRNPCDNIFVWEENGKKVARRGGGGSSGSREINSKFIFGLLELNKVNPIPSYVFLYSEENTLLFIKRFDTLCVPLLDLGGNYYLDNYESKKLKERGMFLRWNITKEIKEVEIGMYT